MPSWSGSALKKRGIPFVVAGNSNCRQSVGIWTPSGDEFFFKTTREYGRADLYRWSAATDEVQFVAEDVERRPSFSRDGQIMAWTSVKRTKQIWLLEQTE